MLGDVHFLDFFKIEPYDLKKFMSFEMVTDRTSVIQAEAKLQAPRLHCVHLTYFEAGKPMEFIACGLTCCKPNFGAKIFTF